MIRSVLLGAVISRASRSGQESFGAVAGMRMDDLNDAVADVFYVCTDVFSTSERGRNETTSLFAALSMRFMLSVTARASTFCEKGFFSLTRSGGRSSA